MRVRGRKVGRPQGDHGRIAENAIRSVFARFGFFSVQMVAGNGSMRRMLEAEMPDLCEALSLAFGACEMSSSDRRKFDRTVRSVASSIGASRFRTVNPERSASVVVYECRNGAYESSDLCAKQKSVSEKVGG